VCMQLEQCLCELTIDLFDLVHCIIQTGLYYLDCVVRKDWLANAM